MGKLFSRLMVPFLWTFPPTSNSQFFQISPLLCSPKPPPSEWQGAVCLLSSASFVFVRWWVWFKKIKVDIWSQVVLQIFKSVLICIISLNLHNWPVHWVAYVLFTQFDETASQRVTDWPKVVSLGGGRWPSPLQSVWESSDSGNTWGIRWEISGARIWIPVDWRNYSFFSTWLIPRE